MESSTVIVSENISKVPIKPVSNFGKDLLKSIASVILAIVVFIFGNILVGNADFLTLIFGFLCIVIGVMTFMNNFREVISSYQYFKAEQVLGKGYYLKGIKPICPYLKVSAGGFQCLLEFTEPFNIEQDLPKCHNAELAKLHWVEKAPQVFEQLKVETGRSIINYIPALGNAKYEPAIPYLENMLQVPSVTRRNSFILQNVQNISSLDALEKKYIEFFKSNTQQGQEHNESSFDLAFEEEELKQLSTEFNTTISLFKKINFIKVQENEVNLTELTINPNFDKQWKLYTSSLVRQYTLASLGLYESERLIPTFVEYIINSTDKKMVFYAKNSLKKQPEESANHIIDLIKDDSVEEEQKLTLLEICGILLTDEMFEFLKDFIDTTDNQIFIAYAISSVGQFGKRGNTIIMETLEKDPDNIILETGRSSLIKTPEYTFDMVLERLKKDDLSDDYLQILISIIEDLDDKTITDKINSMSDEDHNNVIELFEKHNLDDQLDMFIPDE